MAMRHKFGLAIALTLALVTTVPTVARAFDSADKPAVEKIIREYLLSNPELFLEVQQALEAKQKKQLAEKTAKTLVEKSEIIFASKNQGHIGNTKGDVTVVEFFDYNCSFCQRAMADMNGLLKTDNNLKFVLKELPILSEASVEAHRISTAVYRLFPEKYADFHTQLLGSQGQKDGPQALEIAKEMALDLAAIEAESKKADVLDAFREVNELATSLGINGTPSYVIGNEVVFGALGEEALRGMIKNMRVCGKTSCS